MEEDGAIKASPDPKTYIPHGPLHQLLREDSALRAFALGQHPNATSSLAAAPNVPQTTAAIYSKTLSQLVPGIVITTFALMY
jgi:hypothetical protein